MCDVKGEAQEGLLPRADKHLDIELRTRTGLSQARFAELLGVSVRTLQEWEQGRRTPSGAARTLLLTAQKNRKVLVDVA
jgi:putative transcriptional regulator